ncbi:hypothetical protein JCM19233_5150 [Vibrio astriarenae]|nr:hypothetical protein JCM19233_5150 [Vibrio sp. C7]
MQNIIPQGGIELTHLIATMIKVRVQTGWFATQANAHAVSKRNVQ